MKTVQSLAVGLVVLCLPGAVAIAQSGRVPPADQTASGPYKANQVTRKAVVFKKTDPNFTLEARKNNTEGIVRLRMVLTASGEITDISVVHGLPDGLTEEAIAAAKQIRFTPAQKDGRAVSQWVIVEYNFNIYYDETDKVSVPAVILAQPEPEYTELARVNKVTGRVVLKVVLHRSGQVSVAAESVIEGLPHGLTEGAIEAARKIKFTPAEVDGRAISQLRTIEYKFALPTP